MAGRADPKARQRVRLSRHHYGQKVRILLERYPLCECNCGRPSESCHHVVRRGWGDDVYENFMALAGDGTRLCHGAITSKHRVWDAARGVYILPEDVLHGLRARMTEVRIDVLAYVLSTKGQDWVDKHYPARPGSR